jgi:uncharacterized damage-inducible protein DinB
MTDGAGPAAENIHQLEQGIELIRRLDDALFVACPESPFPGGVGAQVRHCVDFYDCLLASLDGGRVDYMKRVRDPRTETDRAHAMDRLRELIDALEQLGRGQAERELQVRSEASPDADGESAWARSSVRRELEFLLSHTIHHYALVVVLLRLHGFTMPAGLKGFGVAPSTERHWRDAGLPSR